MESKKKLKRCTKCSVKLHGVPMECKCAQFYCANHLSSFEHDCTFDYRAAGREALTKQLDTSGLAVKIAKI
jgi:hypothetical protein